MQLVDTSELPMHGTSASPLTFFLKSCVSPLLFLLRYESNSVGGVVFSVRIKLLRYKRLFIASDTIYLFLLGLSTSLDKKFLAPLSFDLLCGNYDGTVHDELD
jgi:hypothetical protein